MMGCQANMEESVLSENFMIFTFKWLGSHFLQVLLRDLHIPPSGSPPEQRIDSIFEILKIPW